MSAQQQKNRSPGMWIFIPALGASLLFSSPTVRDFIQKWESGNKRVLTVYADKLAGGLPTVCNGLTRHVTTTPIIVGEKWTNEKCEIHEQAVTVTLQRELTTCFRRLPPQSVFDAATSHAWNFGVRKTCESTSMAMWNSGKWAYGCLLMAYTPEGKPNWSFVAKQYYPGLFNRRYDEMGLCLSGLGA